MNAISLVYAFLVHCQGLAIQYACFHKRKPIIKKPSKPFYHFVREIRGDFLSRQCTSCPSQSLF